MLYQQSLAGYRDTQVWDTFIQFIIGIARSIDHHRRRICLLIIYFQFIFNLDIEFKFDASFYGPHGIIIIWLEFHHFRVCSACAW